MGHIVRKRFEVAKLGEKEEEYSGDLLFLYQRLEDHCSLDRLNMDLSKGWPICLK